MSNSLPRTDSPTCRLGGAMETIQKREVSETEPGEGAHSMAFGWAGQYPNRLAAMTVHASCWQSIPPTPVSGVASTGSTPTRTSPGTRQQAAGSSHTDRASRSRSIGPASEGCDIAATSNGLDLMHGASHTGHIPACRAVEIDARCIEATPVARHDPRCPYAVGYSATWSTHLCVGFAPLMFHAPARTAATSRSPHRVAPRVVAITSAVKLPPDASPQ